MSKLDGDQLEDEVLLDVEGERGDFGGKQIYGCTFRRGKFIESSWAETRLESCVFEDCDLSRIKLAKARLVDVTFRKSRLMGAEFSNASPNPSVSFEECDLRYAAFVKVNLRKTTFRNCRASEASFHECDLVEASFENCDLGGASFDRCDLGKANFETARGFFADPARNRTNGTRISTESAILLANFFGMKT